jgi:hypothetical protein
LCIEHLPSANEQWQMVNIQCALKKRRFGQFNVKERPFFVAGVGFGLLREVGVNNTSLVPW